MTTSAMKASLIFEIAAKGLESTRELISQLKAVGTETADYEHAADALEAQLGELAQRMDRVDTSVDDLGESQKQLRSDLLKTADAGDKLTRDLRKTAGAANDSGKAADRAGSAWGLFRKAVVAGVGFARRSEPGRGTAQAGRQAASRAQSHGRFGANGVQCGQHQRKGDAARNQ